MDSTKLFSQVAVGPYTLAHRVVLAPMTRMRCNPDDTVSDIMVEYYKQRASQDSLMIMEGSVVSPQGNGFYGSPGIHHDRFIPGFARIAEAVHAKGGRIFAQIYHAGRVSHTSLQPEGGSPIAPSATPFHGNAFTREGQVAASPARALSLEEMPGVVEEFRAAAERVKKAGFDGVEVHFANGYLLDQFLNDSSNQRTDEYGGSFENRSRLPLEVVAAAIEVWGPGRVGIRISPSGTFNEMGDSDPESLFAYLAEELNHLDLAYVHVVEPRISGSDHTAGGETLKPVASAQLRKIYKGKILAAGGFDGESAEAMLDEGAADLIAFGRFYTSNPDLPERIRNDQPLTAYDRSRFYGGGAEGYIDWPAYSQAGA